MTTHTEEEQIDRTLRALTGAAPPPGMKARLLANLEAHRDTAPAVARSPWLSFAGPAAAALLLLFATALWLHLSHPDPSRTSKVGAPSSPAASASVQVGSPLPTKASKPPLSTRMSSPADLPLDRRPKAAAQSSLPSAAPIHLEATLTPSPAATEDAQALADFQAPSLVAPRLPPTAQERLVLLMLRRGEKHDLAQLDRAQQATFAEEEQAARHKFFDPPPPPDPNLSGVPQ